MASKDPEKLKPAGGKRALFLSSETYEKIRKLLAMADLLPDANQFEIIERGGKKHFRLRPEPQANASGGGGSSAPTGSCPFGEIATEAGDTFIRGGIIYCGESNIEVPNQELNLAAEGEWLVWIEVDCIANRDDDNEIFLPGMTSATAPASDWDKVSWSSSASYPDNENPTVSTGSGKIIVPIGRLEIEDGSATLLQASCGNITINQCAGILSHTRE